MQSDRTYFTSNAELEETFRQLCRSLVSAQKSWPGSERDVTTLHHAMLDVIHHVSMAIAGLTPFEDADEGEMVLAREAYLSLIQVLTYTRDMLERDPTLLPTLDASRRETTMLLDLFAPYVSRADHSLRASMTGDRWDVMLDELFEPEVEKRP